jgi:hypothetical protein
VKQASLNLVGAALLALGIPVTIRALLLMYDTTTTTEVWMLREFGVGLCLAGWGVALVSSDWVAADRHDVDGPGNRRNRDRRHALQPGDARLAAGSGSLTSSRPGVLGHVLEWPPRQHTPTPAWVVRLQAD